MEEFESYFDKNCFRLVPEDIYKMDETDNGAINNVISFLQDNCYGVQLFDKYDYQIFYITNRPSLGGYCLDLSLKLDYQSRTYYTIEFCKLLTSFYEHCDIVDTFNAFQSHLRTAFEKTGFYTVANEFDNFPEDKSLSLIVTDKKGILAFPLMKKVDLYRWFFNEDKHFVNIDETKTKKVYLLLDSSNNLIKIGQSYNPSLRERTLQGISPNWDLITTWIAPVEIERQLHKMFESKRVRGEWFKLNFNDLRKVRDFMCQYNIKKTEN